MIKAVQDYKEIILEQYGSGEITYNDLIEQLGENKCYEYRRLINFATKMRNELKLPILKEVEDEVIADEDYRCKIDYNTKIKVLKELDKYYKYLKPQYTLEEFKQKMEEFKEYYHDYIGC